MKCFTTGHPTPVAVSGIANNLLGKTHHPVEGSWKWVPEDPTSRTSASRACGSRTGADGLQDRDHAHGLLGTNWSCTKAGMKMHLLTIFTHEYERWSISHRSRVIARMPTSSWPRTWRCRGHLGGQAVPDSCDEMPITNVIIQGLIDSAAAVRSRSRFPRFRLVDAALDASEPQSMPVRLSAVLMFCSALESRFSGASGTPIVWSETLADPSVSNPEQTLVHAAGLAAEGSSAIWARMWGWLPWS